MKSLCIILLLSLIQIDGKVLNKKYTDLNDNYDDHLDDIGSDVYQNSFGSKKYYRTKQPERDYSYLDKYYEGNELFSKWDELHTFINSVFRYISKKNISVYWFFPIAVGLCLYSIFSGDKPNKPLEYADY